MMPVRTAARHILVLTVQLDSVLPASHEGRCRLVHILFLPGGRAPDDAVIERNAGGTLVWMD